MPRDTTLNLREFAFLVYRSRDLVVRCSDRCGRGAVVVLFKVANDALKNKQIS